MPRQVDLARRTGLSESTAGRVIWSEGYIPDRDTIVALSQALHLSAVQLVIVALDLPDADEQPPTVLHPLVARLTRLLNTLPDTDLKRLEIVADVTLSGFEAGLTQPGRRSA